MGMTNDGLSHWQAETTGEQLLEVTIGDLLDRRANENPTQEALVYSCYPEFGGALDIRWTYQEYRERANAVVSTAAKFVEQTWTSAVRVALIQSDVPSVPATFQEVIGYRTCPREHVG